MSPHRRAGRAGTKHSARRALICLCMQAEFCWAWTAQPAQPAHPAQPKSVVCWRRLRFTPCRRTASIGLKSPWRRPTLGCRATCGITTSALPSSPESRRTCTDAGREQRRNWATSVRCISSVNSARSRHAASRAKYSNWTRVRHMHPRPARWSTSPSRSQQESGQQDRQHARGRDAAEGASAHSRTGRCDGAPGQPTAQGNLQSEQPSQRTARGGGPLRAAPCAGHRRNTLISRPDSR